MQLHHRRVVIDAVPTTLLEVLFSTLQVVPKTVSRFILRVSLFNLPEMRIFVSQLWLVQSSLSHQLVPLQILPPPVPRLGHVSYNLAHAACDLNLLK